MAEPTEVVDQGYRLGTFTILLMALARFLLPKGYRFRWIRLYAERDTDPPQPRDDATPDDGDET